MTWCKGSKDHPLRIKLADGGVVHAGLKQMYGGFSRVTITDGKYTEHRVPAVERVFIACKYGPINNPIEAPQGSEIECKSCQKALGFETKYREARWVVYNTETDTFYRNPKRYCAEPWSPSIYDAFLYKLKGYATKEAKKMKDKCVAIKVKIVFDEEE